MKSTYGVLGLKCVCSDDWLLKQQKVHWLLKHHKKSGLITETTKVDLVLQILRAGVNLSELCLKALRLKIYNSIDNVDIFFSSQRYFCVTLKKHSPTQISTTQFLKDGSVLLPPFLPTK